MIDSRIGKILAGREVMKTPLFILCGGWCFLLNSLPAASIEVPGPVLELPPMVVTANQGLTWRHAEMPGYEILSCCSDAMTRDFMQGLSRAEALLQLLVPKEYWAKSDVPRVIILSVPENLALMPQELLGEENSKPGLIYRGERLTRDGSRIVPNLELGDRDCSMVFATLDPLNFDQERFIMHPAHVRSLLTNRRPPWPDWLVTGAANLYLGLYAATESAESHEHEYGSEVQQLLSSRIGGAGKPRSRRDTVTVEFRALRDTFSIPALEWISEEQTKVLIAEKTRGVSGKTPAAQENELKRFIPLQSMLTHQPSNESADWPVWNAQATLFVRWALGSESPARKEAFWRFVAQTAKGEPATENTFRAAFGYGYDQALVELTEYLRVAIRSPIEVHLPKASPAKAEIRLATETEILRLKEDWTRLVASYLKTRFPEAGLPDQRHRAALRACAEGNRDPRLLAAVGLYESDMEHDKSAQALLEAAAEAKVVRPRVYSELARLRYALKRNFDGSPISAADAAYTVAPLMVGFGQSPPLREYYSLAAEIWLNSEISLTPENIRWLTRGLELFPEDMDLLYRVALLNSRQGGKVEARRLAEQGLKSSLYPEMRAKFEQLRSN